MKAEIWILESLYHEEYYIETLLHISNTDLWFIDQGMENHEDIIDAWFTESFYRDLGYEYILTKVGNL